MTPPDTDPKPSRSHRKREHQALQARVAELLDLPPEQIERLAVDAAIREGLAFARTLRKGARQREIRRVARLVSLADASVVETVLATREARAERDRAAFHRLEGWRDRILEEGDAGVDAWLREHPGGDRQRLRQLARDARRETQAGRPPASARRLYRYLRELAGEEGEEGSSLAL